MKNITLATVKSIIRNGGATINRSGERVEMKTGYQVSKQDLLMMPVNELSKDILKQALNLLEGRAEYVGVWIDGGMAFVDISCRIATKGEAMKRGRELNQISILQWKDRVCLAVE